MSDEYDELQNRYNELQNELLQIRQMDLENGIDPNKTVINSQDYPHEALEQDYIRMESAEAILKDVIRLRNEGTITSITANVLRSLLNPLIGHDFALGTYESHKPVELKAMYNIDVIIALRGIPREDRDTIEVINIVNMIKFQYGVEETRGIPDSTGFNERSRKHINIGENRHVLSGGSAPPNRRRKSVVDFLLRRGRAEGE